MEILEMDWKQFIKEAESELAIYAKELPGTMQGFAKMGAAAKHEGVLSQKTQELVSLAIAIRSQCDHCIAYHARTLVKLKAEREEVAEVLAICAYMAGGPGINYGAKALQAFDQFSEG